MAEIYTAFTGETADKFDAYADTVRGHIRYELVRQNLLQLVPDIAGSRELSVLDVGGGTARDAVWLASLGNHVLVVDPAEDQLAKGRLRINATEKTIQDRVTLLHGTTDQVSKENAPFDLIISHGVMMYVSEPHKFISDLAGFTSVGSHISLLEKGRDATYARLIADNQYKAIKYLNRTGKFINNMNKEVWTFTPDQIISSLRTIETDKTQEGNTINWRGVRVAHDNDYRTVTDVSPEEIADILVTEARLGMQDHTRGMGHMLHFIAKINY